MVTKQEFDELGIKTYSKATNEEILQAEKDCGYIPDDLKNMFRVSNGINFDWFEIYPIYSKSDIKRTWDSLSRVNKIDTSVYISDDNEFLNKFLIFAKLSGPDYAVYEKVNDSIWYSNNKELNKTNLDLTSFIKTVAREVSEL